MNNPKCYVRCLRYKNNFIIQYKNNMRTSFKQLYPLHDRCAESNKVLQKYPDKIPIICERSSSAKRECKDLDRIKYLVSKDLTIGQFIYFIRSKMKLPREKAIFLFINGCIPPSSCMMGQFYKIYQADDGFLYITYSYENTFG